MERLLFLHVWMKGNQKMIRISHISLPIDETSDALRKKAAQELGLREGQLTSISIARQSIDARKKHDIRYVYTVDVTAEGEEQLLKTAPGKHLTPLIPQAYVFPAVKRTSLPPPVIVGLGPAGLFSALFLARAGLPPIILERGQDVDSRTQAVARFWSTGILDPQSNVQFGEGGAGTFSDGKLTTGTHDPRSAQVIETFLSFGAPEDIRYSHKPHIGTDILRQVVKRMRQELLRLGCDIRFGHQLTGLCHSGGQLTALDVTAPNERYLLPCQALVLAPGHSARDTFALLDRCRVPMEQKSFAIGVRIEHPQHLVSAAQYGPSWEQLPPSDYKLSCHLPSGRSAFTFCVCPGGQVVAAASEEGHLVTNGMSRRAREETNCNGGFLVGITPNDIPGDDPMAGVRFQRRWEQAAFQAGGGGFRAPCLRLEDFLAGNPGEGPGSVLPTYLPGVTWTGLDSCLPSYVTDTLRASLPLFDRKLHGFSSPDALLTGVETRSSSPVRILRDSGCQSALRGLFPCGEGAGYAGGIVSAAVDGIRVAECVAGA